MMSIRGLSSVRHAVRTAGVRCIVPRQGLAFSASAKLGLKESSNETDVDYEKHKRDSLAKQKQGSGHWKPELASDSEEAIRADRSGPEDPKELQERTKHSAEETSKAGTSMRE